jgi:hypothetical protein
MKLFIKENAAHACIALKNEFLLKIIIGLEKSFCVEKLLK